jgi:transmembrane sensor
MNAVRGEEQLRRLATASGWRAVLAEADCATTPEFEAWLRDPLNESAWDQVQAGWLEVGERASDPEMLELRQSALEHAGQRGRGFAWPGWRAGAAAMFALILGASVIFGAMQWRATQPTLYATALGERRVIELEDGSKVSLDAATEVSVRYTGDARRLELLHGQARFDVAHDTLRPFSVRAGSRTVVATGTAFTVDLVGGRVTVMLIEGRVVVLDREKLGRDETARVVDAARTKAAVDRGDGALSAGQQLNVAPTGPSMVDPVSIERATSWEQGQLIVEDEPLGDVAARVGRYTTHRIMVAPDAAGLRISGVFTAGDVDTFIDTIGRYLPVRADTQADGTIRVSRKESSR